MKVLVNLDLTRNQILNARLQNLAGAPTDNLVEGLIYYDTGTKTAYYYNGTTWISANGGSASTLDGQSGSYYRDRANHTGTQAASTISDLATVVQAYRLDQFAAPTAAVSANSQRITNLADPTSDQDAATRAYVLARVAALVDSAPGVLDTLNELAAALGDDPNFATSIAGQISDAKARVNHTGTQTASTISDFDTAADARVALRGFAADVGDGTSTVITVTHNLGSRDVVVVLREAAAPYAYVYPDVEAATTNTVTLRFATAPTAAQYRALVHRVA
jgi:hypothetical protein